MARASLLGALEHEATRSNPVVRLETNAALAEAVRLHRSSGYVQVPPVNDEGLRRPWFEKRLAA